MYKQPTMYMMIGVPASGKSTYIKNQLSDIVSVSTDEYIESFARTHGKTYNVVFKDNIKDAENFMLSRIESFTSQNISFIWDQTNLTKKIRAKKLSMIPKCYKKIAIFFETPTKEEHEKRLNSRPGKIIPSHILDSMINQLEFPSFDEGFEQIIYEGYKP